MRALIVGTVAMLALCATPASARPVPKSTRASDLHSGALVGCGLARDTTTDDFQRKCYSSDTGEYRFRMPKAPLREHKDVRAQVDRVSAELAEGMDMTARQDREDAKAGGVAFQPWQVELQWSLDGINPQLASLSLEGKLSPRPSRNPHVEPHETAIAVLMDRRSGRLISDATDVFSDHMENLRSTYCTHLDIQRIANALHAAPEASIKDESPIIDEQGRYLGQWACPYFGELAISFAGKRGQPFETIGLVAHPGIAGPQHEGYYRVTLEMNATMLAQIRPEYRDAFRVYQGCKDCAAPEDK